MTFLISFVFAVILYFLPTVIGLLKMRSNIWAIILMNIFFGWTVIGWLVALYMSVKTDAYDRVGLVIKALEGRKYQ